MSRLVIKPREADFARAAGLMLVAYAAFTVLDSAAKLLAPELASGQIVFVRYLGHVMLMSAVFVPIYRLSLLKSRAPWLELLRGGLLLVTTFFNITAVGRMPLAAYAAIALTAPLLITALSVPLLGEKVGIRRWSAIGVGFIGAMIVVQPGAETFQPAALLVLAGAFLGSLYAIITRKLAGIDAAATQLFYTGIIATIGSLPLALSDWRWPVSGTGWFAFAIIGAAGWAGHHALASAFRMAPASTLTPFMYSQMVFMVAAGLLVFGEWPAPHVAFGATLIVASGIYVWYRERKLSASLPAPQADR